MAFGPLELWFEQGPYFVQKHNVQSTLQVPELRAPVVSHRISSVLGKLCSFASWTTQSFISEGSDQLAHTCVAADTQHDEDSGSCEPLGHTGGALG